MFSRSKFVRDSTPPDRANRPQTLRNTSKNKNLESVPHRTAWRALAFFHGTAI
jgi:hypothetical protein